MSKKKVPGNEFELVITLYADDERLFSFLNLIEQDLEFAGKYQYSCPTTREFGNGRTSVSITYYCQVDHPESWGRKGGEEENP